MVLKRIIVCFAFLAICEVCEVFAQQNKILIATLEYPPFIYSDGDQVKGPIVDKVKNIFGRLGVDVTIQILPIARGLLMVKNGEVDAYFSLKKTPEREQDLLFTHTPLIQQPFVFFVKNNSKILWNGNLDDVKNYTIGVVSKTSYGMIFDEYVKNKNIPHIDEAQSFELNVKKLIAGRVDLVINSYDVGQFLLRKFNSENEVVALNPPVEIINSYLAFTKVRDYSYLADQFDVLLSEENK